MQNKQSSAAEAIAPQTIDQAAHWFVGMREASITAAQREAFVEWLRVSPVNVRAYLEIAGIWGEAAQLDPEHRIAVDEAAAAAVVPLRQGQAQFATPRAKPPLRRRRMLIAAALLLPVIGAGLWWNLARAPLYVCGIGEQRVLTFEDGSVLRMNSRTQVRVRWSAARRDIELLSGQAMFEVAKDPARPFVVRSGGVAVRALGTAFDVYRKSAGTVVTVVEGKVEVRSTAGQAPERTAAGEQITVAANGMMRRNPAANVAAAVSWQQQELMFAGEPLSVVVEEFNRYTRRRIVLADESLADLRINAVFHSTSPESLLRFVRRMPGVAVEETDREVRIRHRAH